MIHASQHVRAFRLMKDITKRQGAQGKFTFYGKNDFARQAQLPLFGPDTGELKQHMLEKFAGQEITFSNLCDELYTPIRPATTSLSLTSAESCYGNASYEEKVQMNGRSRDLEDRAWHSGIQYRASLPSWRPFPSASPL